MESKEVLGRTVFFLALCAFVAVFTHLFGDENSLVGVMVVVMALMLLSRDLSDRPAVNCVGMVAVSVCLGLGAFVSLIDPVVGLAVNIVTVLAVSYLTTDSMDSPVHFPFLLGYGFLLSSPVSVEGLPLRLLSLAVGSVLAVGLNVALGHGRLDSAFRATVSGCVPVLAECAELRASGKECDVGPVYAACDRVDRIVCGRGSVTERGAYMMECTAELRCIAHWISTSCDTARLATASSALRGFGDGAACGTGCGRVDSLRTRVDAVLTGDSLRNGGRVGMGPRVLDMGRVSFAVRMALLFSFWAFLWQYWGEENAKWLVFTTVALVQPYTDGAGRKSVMRVTGTLVGAAVFIVFLVVSGGDGSAMVAALLFANYLNTVLDPDRYDVSMAFITFSALAVSSMADPSSAPVLDRVAFILLGVVSAMAANHLLLPLRRRDRVVRTATACHASSASLATGPADMSATGSRRRFVEARRAWSRIPAPDCPDCSEFCHLQSMVSSHYAAHGYLSGTAPDDRTAALMRDWVSEGRSIVVAAMTRGLP